MDAGHGRRGLTFSSLPGVLPAAHLDALVADTMLSESRRVGRGEAYGDLSGKWAVSAPFVSAAREDPGTACQSEPFIKPA